MARPMPESGAKLIGLDLVRAIASLMVLTSHVGAWWIAFYPHAVPGLHLMGHMGVEVFFVLSGYLIGGVLIRLGPLSGGRLARFWMRRLLRTIPVFLIALGLFWLLTPRSNSDASLLRYLTHTAFMPIMGEHREVWFPVTWSLAVEEWAYLLVPIALMTGMRLGASRLLCLVGVLATLLGVRWAMVFMGLPPADSMMGTPFRMDPILWGMLAACIPRSWISARWQRVMTFSGLLILIFCMIWLLSFSGVREMAAFRTVGWTGLDLGLAAGICLLTLIPAWRGGLARLIAFGAATSYPVYLIHLLPVIVIGTDAPTLVQAALYTVTTVAVAYGAGWLLHRLVEDPCVRLGLRFKEKAGLPLLKHGDIRR